MPFYLTGGIYEHFDNGGLELNRHTCENVFPILGDRKDVPETINRLIAEGKTGQKAGQGFYDWREVDMDAYRESQCTLLAVLPLESSEGRKKK